MADFKFRDTLEGWVEGLFDVVDAYLRTLFLLNLRPVEAIDLLLSPEEKLDKFSRPSIFLIVSYLLMCLMILDVDFSDPVFSLDLAQRLNALGVLDAAKNIKIEKLLLSIFPAVLLLFCFVYLSLAVLRLLGDSLEARVLRRNYSYMLGSYFLLFGTASGGYEYLVKPLASQSWWLGLPVHGLTIIPIIGVLAPFLSICYSGVDEGRVRPWKRLVALSVPFLGLMLVIRYISGSFYFMDYLRLR